MPTTLAFIFLSGGVIKFPSASDGRLLAVRLTTDTGSYWFPTSTRPPTVSRVIHSDLFSTPDSFRYLMIT